MSQYLIVYRKSTGTVEQCNEYSNTDLATVLKERARLERMYGAQGDVEVVVLGARNTDDLVKTHSRYFKSLRELATSA